MNPAAQRYAYYSKNPWVQLFLLILLFALFQSIHLFAFYDGFLHSFNKISITVFNTDNEFLTAVPFYSSSLFAAALVNPFFLFALAGFAFPLAFFRKRISPGLFSKTNRILLTVCALTLAWELVTYEYNYYLDRAFYFDRLVLVMLAFSLWKYPLLAPVFTAFAFLYRAQFNFPEEGFLLVDKKILFDVLILFTAMCWIHIIVPGFRFSFLFWALCLAGGNYFCSGMAKIFISPHGYEWLVYNNPADLFYNVHYRGWMAGAGEDTVSGIGRFLENYGNFMQWFVFLLECCGIFLLFSRRISLFVLSGLFFMHAGIFVFGSMLFWKWMVLDFVLILIIWLTPAETTGLFNRKMFLFSVIALVSSFLWMRPATIAWADTPFTQYFTWEVTDDKGDVYNFSKNDFNPYHQWIQYDRFLFLVNKKCLPVSGFGYTMNMNMAQKIKACTANGILSLEEAEGTNYYDAEKAKRFSRFMQTYFMARNKRTGSLFVPSLFCAPHHLYTSVSANRWANDRQVKKLHVVFNQVYTENGKPVVITKTVVQEIEIPAN